MEKLERRKAYKKEVDLHRKYVYAAYYRYFTVDDHLLYMIFKKCGKKFEDRSRKKLHDRMINHDNSKYSDEEFEPYMNYFKGESTDKSEKIKEEFEKACQHHYKNNDHHPEYWNPDKDNVENDMDPLALIEMSCDLIAVSSQHGGDVVKWWEENKDKKPMTVRDKYILTWIFDYLKNMFGNLDVTAYYDIVHDTLLV